MEQDSIPPRTPQNARPERPLADDGPLEREVPGWPGSGDRGTSTDPSRSGREKGCSDNLANSWRLSLSSMIVEAATFHRRLAIGKARRFVSHL